MKKKNYIGDLKADPLLNMVGQHYPRLGLHDAPSGAGTQKLEVKNNMKNTKNENLKAQFISNSVLRKLGSKNNPPPTEFYLKETGNCKPETGNENKKMGLRMKNLMQ